MNFGRRYNFLNFMNLAIQIRQLEKGFRSPQGQLCPVLKVADFQLEEGHECALEGPSGTGKSTFLNVISGLIPADKGSVKLAGQELLGLGEVARDRLRARYVGYIFQSFRLLPSLSAVENVLLGMVVSDSGRARELLGRVGLADHSHHKPHQLSIGQRQRVAVARALANRPGLILADEPTASLDPKTGAVTLRLIRELCRESRSALLLVSHDIKVLAEFERVESFAEVNQP